MRDNDAEKVLEKLFKGIDPVVPIYENDDDWGYIAYVLSKIQSEDRNPLLTDPVWGLHTWVTTHKEQILGWRVWDTHGGFYTRARIKDWDGDEGLSWAKSSLKLMDHMPDRLGKYEDVDTYINSDEASKDTLFTEKYDEFITLLEDLKKFEKATHDSQDPVENIMPFLNRFLKPKDRPTEDAPKSGGKRRRKKKTRRRKSKKSRKSRRKSKKSRRRRRRTRRRGKK